MPDEYVCPKCSQKLGREARHKPGSQIYNEHQKYLKITMTPEPKDTDFVIDESDGIPADLVQDILDNNAEIAFMETHEKPAFEVKKKTPNIPNEEIDLSAIPANAKFVTTQAGLMIVVRDETGTVAGLFDPNDSIEKINFRKEYYGWYIPDSTEFECRKFITRPFTEIEKLKYAKTIADFQRRKYTFFQRIRDAKRLKELLVKQDAKPR